MAIPTGQDALTSAVTTVGAAAGAALAEGLAGPLVYFLSSAAQSMSAKVGGPGGGQLPEQFERFLHEWANTVERRKLLRLLGWTAASVVVSPVVGNLNLDTDEQERVGGAIASPSRVDEQVIEHINAVFRHCQQQDDVLGPRVVLNTVLAQSTVVHDLLKECPTDLRPRLLSVYSRMSSSAGGYFFELNDDNHAGYHYEQARTAAHAAHNVELAVYALCLRSHAAFLQDEAHTSIDLAAAAQSLVTKIDDALLQAFAGQVAAGAYAVDGQYAACMTELERAEASLSNSGPISPHESPAYYYHEGYLLRRKSAYLLRLRKPQEAVVSASAGLALCENSHADNTAYSTLSLGDAYLQADEIDEAAQVIGNAACLAAQNRSARLVQDVQDTRARMQPWQGTQAVKVLDERLGEYGLRVGVGR